MSDIRKKAIARLHYMIGNIKDFASDSKHLSEDDKADLEALGMAVKSLETDEAYDLMYEEPDFCEDCISRKTALMYIDIPQGGTLNDIRDAIRKMPSVLPKATKNDLAHCQHTDEEIAKSFIEDVEAVKDQLPTTKNDLALIHTEGLDEEIRCTMCTNSMKSDRGCDGSCVVNNDMYKAVMDAIEKRIQPTTKNDLGVDAISRAEVLKIFDEWFATCDIADKKDSPKIKIKALPSVTLQEPRKGYCKDCKYFDFNSVAEIDGIPFIVEHKICLKWANGCETSEDGYCFLFKPKEDMREVVEE